MSEPISLLELMVYEVLLDDGMNELTARRIAREIKLRYEREVSDE